MSLRELRAKRTTLLAEAKTLTTNPDFTAEMQTRLDAIFAELDTNERQVTLAEREERTTAAAESSPSEPASPVAMTFRDKETGGEVRSLGRRETFADRTPDPENLRFGPIMRAVLTGDRGGLNDAEMRAASEGTTTAGGFLVPSPISARVYDIIRARSSILRAGSTIVPMQSRTCDLVKVTTSGTVGWLAENAQGSSADIVLARVQLVAKTLACYAEASIELVQDSDPSFSAVLESTIGAAMATELDRACLDGSGSGAVPTGLYNLGSIANISLVPAAATYLAISRAISQVQGQNFDPNAVIVTSRDAGVLDRLVDTTNQPLNPTPLCAALMPFIVSNQRSSEVGSPQDSKAAVGDFQYAVVGLRQGLMIETSNVAVTGSDSAWDKRQIHFRATLRADFQVVLPAAFCTLDFGAPSS